MSRSGEVVFLNTRVYLFWKGAQQKEAKKMILQPKVKMIVDFITRQTFSC